MNNEMNLNILSLICKRCGYGSGNHPWNPRVKHPAVCPKCKSYGWETPKKVKKLKKSK